MIVASPAIQKYFNHIESETKRAYAVATEARSKGYDPEKRVDIPLAANMAERVVGLISLVAPQLAESNMTQRIKELEAQYGHLDWRVGLKIAEEVAFQKFCPFETKELAMDIAIRVGFAYLTLGIVAAPLEGFIGLKIKKRADGQDYLAIYYAGPVRGAGGTAAATSVLLSDYVRTVMGLAPYDPTDEEVNRYVTEVSDYHERVTNLQYRPSDDEVRFLAKHIPVEINGDPTEEIEVSNYKDLKRVETNRIRGGICLVLAEGVAQKSPKMWIRISAWGKDFGLKWDFLGEFLDLQKKIKAQQATAVKSPTEQISPNFTFIADLVAGRPILSYPLKNGGFRLRYGRTHTSGFSNMGIHPATLAVLDQYIAIGTQLKTERPGKGATVTLCDSIDGPTVKLEDGSVTQLHDAKQVKQLHSPVLEIIYIGDLLVSYGDFSENGHKLVPAGYCEEWWVLEVEKARGDMSIDSLAASLQLEPEMVLSMLKNPLSVKPSFACARDISNILKVPMHPSYTYMWNSITSQSLVILNEWVGSARIEKDGDTITKIIIPMIAQSEAKRALELIAVPHRVINNEFVVITSDHAQAFAACLRIEDHPQLVIPPEFKGATLELVQTIAPFTLRDKNGTFIGARMGRPEKAKMRKLAGQPHILFPVGDEGSRMRTFQSALLHGKVTADFAFFICNTCKKESVYPYCLGCNTPTERWYICRDCGTSQKDKCSHGKKKQYKKQQLDIQFYFQKALEHMGISAYPDVIKGVHGTSNEAHTVEHLAKGILRAKHNIFVNKDGTTRYDMTELPLTHFKPKEIGTSLDKLRELGYERDVFGKELTHVDQILELKPQDIVMPLNENSLEESSKKILYRIAKFIDELLERLYKLPSYYNLQNEDDIVGHLVIGLAPHISAGLIGRIIGFTQTQGCFAHPMWHAGLRRDCDGDENAVMLLLDGLLNFSRQYLPNMRGAKTMDSPLVLTSLLIPSEVDDQSHGLDVAWQYPLQLYESALLYKSAKEVKIDQIKHRLDTEKQYEQFGFTHAVSDLNNGVKCSSYKLIPTMEEKLAGQIRISQRIRAVNPADVARLIIEKHFIKDIKGNLRKFSMQKFRCIQCGEQYRRPPLIGKCTVCSGKIIFTVTEGSIVKYLGPSFSLARQFELPPYLVQTLEITRRRIEGVFGRDKEKQAGLGGWA